MRNLSIVKKKFFDYVDNTIVKVAKDGRTRFACNEGLLLPFRFALFNEEYDEFVNTLKDRYEPQGYHITVDVKPIIYTDEDKGDKEMKLYFFFTDKVSINWRN